MEKREKAIQFLQKAFTQTSLTTSSDLPEQCMINVPQGCYGVINQWTTPKNVKGMFTDGMDTCTCIIVSDKERKNIVLAHVDAQSMNLADPDHGLKKWIELIPDGEIDIQINFDKRSEYPYNYQKQIQSIIDTFPEEKRNKIKITAHNEGKTAALVFRENEREKVMEKIHNPTGQYTRELKNNDISYNLNTDGLEVVLKQLLGEDSIIKFNNTRDWRYNGYNKNYYNDFIDETQDYKETNIKKESKLFQMEYEVFEKECKIQRTGCLSMPPICCYDGSINVKEIKIEDGLYKKLDEKYKEAFERTKNDFISIIKSGITEYDEMFNKFDKNNIERLKELERIKQLERQNTRNNRGIII